ncbi:UDP-glucuronate 4-epimerase (UGA4E) (TgUGAE), partial [Durusdinium trenchii]
RKPARAHALTHARALAPLRQARRSCNRFYRVEAQAAVLQQRPADVAWPPRRAYELLASQLLQGRNVCVSTAIRKARDRVEQEQQQEEERQQEPSSEITKQEQADSRMSDSESNSDELLSIWSSNGSVSSAAEGKVVLVTGGAGFIGSHTAEVLLGRGDSVVVIDEMNDYYDVDMKRGNIALLEAAARDESQFTFYEGDISDKKLVEQIFVDHGITHVCHLAARAGVRPSIKDPFLYVQSNVTGTVTLLEAAAKHGVENFVYASSSSVYGGSDKTVFSEDDSVDKPVSQYAATKKACELMAATYHSLYGLNTTGLRFFTVYGPRGRPDMAPFKFMHRVVNGIQIERYGDGSSARDYTFISDIVAGTVLAIDKPLGCEVVNLGKGNTCKLNDFIATIERLCNRRAIIKVLPDQPGDVPYTCASVDRARELLGYSAKVQLEEGLQRTLTWYSDFMQQKPQRDEVQREQQLQVVQEQSVLA